MIFPPAEKEENVWYLSQKWDFAKLSDRVIKFNQMSDGTEKERERRILISLTETLIYLIPLERNYLKEEDLASFFLEQRCNAEKILTAYTVSRLRYDEYISQVLRKRCFTFTMREKLKKEEQERLSEEEGRENLIDKEEMTLMEPDFEYVGRKISTEDFGSMTLREVIKCIVDSPVVESQIVLNEKEIILKSKLTEKRKRRQFLAMLLNIPTGDYSSMAEHLAAVYQTIPELFVRFFELKEEEKGDKKEGEERNKAVRNRHYRLLLRLEESYMRCEDDDEKKEIISSYEKLRSAFEKRNMQIREAQKGLSQREIAKILGISPALVSLHIRTIRELLRELSNTILFLDGERS